MTSKTKEPFTTAEMQIIKRFLKDMVTVPEAAKRIGISAQHLYLELRVASDKIPPEAIVQIDNIQLLRWSIMKNIKFRTYKKRSNQA